MSEQEHQKRPLDENDITVDAYRKRIAEHLREQLRQADICASQSKNEEAVGLLTSEIESVLKEFIDSDEAKAFIDRIRNSQFTVLTNQGEIQKAGFVNYVRAMDIMDSLFEKMKGTKNRNRILRLKQLMQSAGKSFIRSEEFFNQLFPGYESVGSSTVNNTLSRINKLIETIDPQVQLGRYPHGNANSESDRWVGLKLRVNPTEMLISPTPINSSEGGPQQSNDKRLDKLIDTVHLLSKRLQVDNS